MIENRYCPNCKKKTITVISIAQGKEIRRCAICESEDVLAVDQLILEQLTILNAAMKILVEEHLRHFSEWRSKNGL